MDRIEQNKKKLSQVNRLINESSSNQSKQPEKKRNKKRKRTISLRFDPDRYEEIKQVAHDHHAKISDLTRTLLYMGMEKNFIARSTYSMPNEDKDYLKKLNNQAASIGNNINQIARANNYFNKNIAPSDIISDEKLIREHDQYNQKVQECIQEFQDFNRKVDQLCQSLLM